MTSKSVGDGSDGIIARVAIVAVRGKKFGEEHADDGTEERKTGADDGDVAFGSGPVGCSNVAVGRICAGRDGAETGETEDAGNDDTERNLISFCFVMHIRESQVSHTGYQ